MYEAITEDAEMDYENPEEANLVASGFDGSSRTIKSISRHSMLTAINQSTGSNTLASIANVAEKTGLKICDRVDRDCFRNMIDLKIINPLLNRPITVVVSAHDLVKT